VGVAVSCFALATGEWEILVGGGSYTNNVRGYKGALLLLFLPLLHCVVFVGRILLWASLAAFTFVSSRLLAALFSLTNRVVAPPSSWPYRVALWLHSLAYHWHRS